jgi:hypothetical protein
MARLFDKLTAHHERLNLAPKTKKLLFSYLFLLYPQLTQLTQATLLLPFTEITPKAMLCRACSEHTYGRQSSCATVTGCWDAVIA